jgi:hypothetical protein
VSQEWKDVQRKPWGKGCALWPPEGTDLRDACSSQPWYYGLSGPRTMKFAEGGSLSRRHPLGCVQGLRDITGQWHPGSVSRNDGRPSAFQAGILALLRSLRSARTDETRDSHAVRLHSAVPAVDSALGTFRG